MGDFWVFVKQKTDMPLYTLIFQAIPNNLTMDYPRIHRLSSLPEIRGGGCADVLRYFKCPPTKKIR
jgi:hypothetical protein